MAAPSGALEPDSLPAPQESTDQDGKQVLKLPESAHPDLGKLGVFWHTQGSGKSYSMAFFAEKVRRTISGKFTFLLMTDRNDLDDQIYKTFWGAASPISKPRAPIPARTCANACTKTTASSSA
jgi:type I restriction enzyme R subunit